MFTDSQLFAKGLVKDIRAVEVKEKFRWVRFNKVQKAEKILDAVDMVGHAKEEQLKALEDIFEYVKRLQGRKNDQL